MKVGIARRFENKNHLYINPRDGKIWVNSKRYKKYQKAFNIITLFIGGRLVYKALSFYNKLYPATLQ
mgnify:CR=1 FL=1